MSALIQTLLATDQVDVDTTLCYAVVIVSTFEMQSVSSGLFMIYGRCLTNPGESASSYGLRSRILVLARIRVENAVDLFLILSPGL